MKASHHPDYVLPLPEGHPFPMGKYARLHALLLERGVLSPAEEKAVARLCDVLGLEAEEIRQPIKKEHRADPDDEDEEEEEDDRD